MAAPHPQPTSIEIPTPEHVTPTQPVLPSARLPPSSISIEPCTPADAPTIALTLYTCFPETMLAKSEPPARRPPPAERLRRMSLRILPLLSEPKIHFIKAVHRTTGATMGVAGWMAPGLPVYNPWLRSAVAYYGFDAKMGWSAADVDEMWGAVEDEGWDGAFGPRDVERRAVMGDEEHWFLAPLLTFPEYQGKGVGSLLLRWAIEQADATVPPTPMYLESAATARAVYMHHGFVPVGEVNMVRRGPVVVRETEAREGKEGKGGSVDEKGLHGERGLEAALGAASGAIRGC